MPVKSSKPSISDFKNRMDSPFVGVMINPKTKKPIRKTSSAASKKKSK